MAVLVRFSTTSIIPATTPSSYALALALKERKYVFFRSLPEPTCLSLTDLNLPRSPT
nr:hypothetical protein Q903MT_gene6386 [Picea sitchensis]